MPDIKDLKIKIEQKKETPESFKEVSLEKTVPLEAGFESGEKQKVEQTAREQALAGKGEGELGAGAISGIGIGDSRQKQREKQIEKILEKDMKSLYLGMLPEKQHEFKVIGEQTALEINVLLEKARVNIKKIVNLIKKWLLIIPGVNKFFIEQEAKIKADEIIKIKKEKNF